MSIEAEVTVLPGHAGFPAPHRDDVAGHQLASPAQIDLTVHGHVTGRDQHLGLATGVDQISQFEELAESDHVAADLHRTHGHHHAESAERKSWTVEPFRRGSRTTGRDASHPGPPRG